MKKYYKRPASSAPKKGKKDPEFKKTGNYLVIVESPSKCKIIEGYLGEGYTVIASYGHIQHLKSIKDIDIPNGFIPKFTIADAKTKHIEKLRSIITQYSPENVILATDSDREGEAIAYHIATVFSLPVDTTKRIVFNEITRTALTTAINNPTTINQSMVKSQFARQIIDIVIGFKVSPLLWKRIYASRTNALSAGRCQTPALKLVYENYLESLDAVPKLMYKVVGEFFSYQLKFELDYEFSEKNEVVAYLEATKKHNHLLSVGEKRTTTKSPPKPLNTSRLLQVSSNTLGYPPKLTMSIAQQLYQAGLITYMRTENQKYSESFLSSAKTFIETRFKSDKYVGDLNKLMNRNSLTPHEAIRVSNISMNAITNTDSRVCSLYKLIWKNTIESCMSDAVYNSYTVSISGAMNHRFYSVIDIPVFTGWRESDIINKPSYAVKTENPALIFNFLNSVSKTSPVKFNCVEACVCERETHSHYTESGLIHKLETLGIGRPSTFSHFIETIEEKGYVKKINIEGKKMDITEYVLEKDGVIRECYNKRVFGAEKNKLVIQPLGIVCAEFLLETFNELFDYNYTNTMETELDKIEHATGNNNDDDSGAETGDIDTIYRNLCGKTIEDIKKQTANAKNTKKLEYRIDERHTLSFSQSGPCIKVIKEKEQKDVKKCGGGEAADDDDDDNDTEFEYIPIRTDIEFDLNKVKNNQYTAADLLCFDKSELGSYNGVSVNIKVGKFGSYIEHGDTKFNLDKFPKPLKEITLEDAIRIIDGIDSFVADPKGLVKTLNSELSIRRGRFGHYIYYKTAGMTTPKFFNLKKFKGKYLSCEPEILISWIKHTYLEE